MRFRPSILFSATAIAITCVVSAAAYFYKTRTVEHEINEVMVLNKSNVFKKMDEMMIHVESAKKCIDVCMPSIRDLGIYARLIKAVSEDKIKLRILIDLDRLRGHMESVLIEGLIYKGAEVRCRAQEMNNMQQKFCVVDDLILLKGTFNWGDNLPSDHYMTYVHITSNSELVDPYKKEFGQMWSKGLPLVDALYFIFTSSERFWCPGDEYEISR